MRDYKIVFIHGYTASSKVNWYPEMVHLLSAKGIECVVPDLPGGKYPHIHEWLEGVHLAVGDTTKPLVLVGHSLGTRALLLYLEKFQPHVKAAFLVAAFNNDTANGLRYDGESYPDFFAYKIDLRKVIPLVDTFVVIHSKDDSSIPYTQGVEMAEDLGAELRTYEDRDHFSAPENAAIIFSELERVLDF